MSAGLVACLQNFKGLFNPGIIGSAGPYRSLVIPNGSSPITDPLLSSASFKVIHDGAAFDRTDKVAALAQWQADLDGLRVCWQGSTKSENCGHCEKCVRTKLNFQANRLPMPKSLSKEATVKDIQRISIDKPPLENEWRMLLEAAEQNDIKADWVSAVRWKLRRARLIIRVKRILVDKLDERMIDRLQSIREKVGRN